MSTISVHLNVMKDVYTPFAMTVLSCPCNMRSPTLSGDVYFASLDSSIAVLNFLRNRIKVFDISVQKTSPLCKLRGIGRMGRCFEKQLREGAVVYNRLPVLCRLGRTCNIAAELTAVSENLIQIENGVLT